MRHEQIITLDELARYTHGRTDEIKRYMDLGFLPVAHTGSLSEPLFYPNAIDVVHFVRKVNRLGFQVEEVRTMLLLVDLFGGSCDYIATAVQEKLDAVREKMTDLIGRERELMAFETQCRRSPSFLARLATRPASNNRSLAA